MDVSQRLTFFSTLYWLFLGHVNGISTNGYLLITNVCYQNTVSLTAVKKELTNTDGLECRRQCATRESCKACHVFTHSVTKIKICHLYFNNLCDTNEVTMYQNLYVTNGSIWEKIAGENINNATTCKNEQNCVISTGFPTASTATLFPSSTGLGTSGTTSGQVSAGSSTYGSTAGIKTGAGLFNASTSETPVTYNFAETSSESTLSASSSSVQSSVIGNQTTGIAAGNSSTGESTSSPISASSTTETTISSTVQNTTSSTSIPSTSTNPTITNTTLSTVQSTTTSTATAFTTGIPTTTGKPAEPRPRTCWDYYAHNGTLDVPGYGEPRPIWPTGFSNGTSITAYCRNGYTAIILNHAILTGIFSTYDNKNYVTVFGSTTQRLPSTNTTGWNAYISSINFPVLSALVRASNRTLYYEQQADLLDAVGIYSGLDITPDGTLTVQGSLQVVAGFNPPNGFSPPVINSSWVSGTCGSSFWKIPVTSTDICNQATNILLPEQNQKVGGKSRRFVGLAFR